LPPQLPEQHWPDVVHDVPAGWQAVHAGLVAQAGSEQSTRPLQFSSRPPEHASVAFGRTLAFASLQSPCEAQKPSPSASVHGWQSRWQFAKDSSPLQTLSPQQTEIACVVHDPQRLASQPTGFSPPNPQQKRALGLPLWRPSQSAGQVTHVSPLPAWQTPSPQAAPTPWQSAGHPAQVSVASQTPLAHAA
jgi:hypothetical protein